MALYFSVCRLVLPYSGFVCYCFILFYYLLLLFYILLFLLFYYPFTCLFSESEHDMGEWEGGEHLGGLGREGTIIQIYGVKKIYLTLKMLR